MRTKSLAFLAGIIWLTAGFNICQIGVATWKRLDTTSVVTIIGSIVTMILFSSMFIKMLFRNVRRIQQIDIERRKLWNIMSTKSYFIMAFMIMLGILLRRCPAITSSFIAPFYVGLGVCINDSRRDICLCFFLSKEFIALAKKVNLDYSMTCTVLYITTTSAKFFS